MKALIGSTGFIGSVISKQTDIDHFYHRTNIADISNTHYEKVYCAAPAGSRLEVLSNPQKDSANIDNLITNLDKLSVEKIVLISTVDAVSRLDTVYGQNRKHLEEFVSSRFNNFLIVRLPSLIHKEIQKNILYDIKHKMYLSKINLLQNNQWYPLNNLVSDLEKHTNGVINLVSEPILNSEIVDRFMPGIGIQMSASLYDLQYSGTSYLYSKEEIFLLIEEYLNG